MFGCFPFLLPQGITYTAYKSFRNLNSGVYLGFLYWKVFFYLTPIKSTFQNVACYEGINFPFYKKNDFINHKEISLHFPAWSHHRNQNEKKKK